MWLGCKLTHTFLSAAGTEMSDAPTVKTLSRERTGRAGGGQEGPSEEVPGRMTRNQLREMPEAGTGQAGSRNQEKGSLELVRGGPAQS